MGELYAPDQSADDQPAVKLPSPTSDELLQRAKLGDLDAFESLYEELAPVVYGVCVGVLTSGKAAAASTQATFVELLHHAGDVDAGRSSVKGLASSIAHRLAADSARSTRTRRQEASRFDRRSTSMAEPVVPEPPVRDRSKRQATDRALSGLTTLQRESIELAYFGGQTYREVAETLGVTNDVVRTSMRDGLRSLSRIMASNGGQLS